MNIFSRCGLRPFSVGQISGVAADFNTSDCEFMKIHAPRLIDDMIWLTCQGHGKPLFPVSLIKSRFLAEKHSVESSSQQ